MKTFLLFALMVLTLLFADRAHACVCISEAHPAPKKVKADRALAYEKATAVFIGKVVAIDTFKVKFAVDKLWKGESQEEIIMGTGAVDTGNGTYSSSSCDYDFSLGGEYLVYAYGSAEKMTTFACSRTRLIEYAAEEEKGLDEIKPHENIGKKSKEQAFIDDFSEGTKSNKSFNRTRMSKHFIGKESPGRLS